jgi:hypothetical protein
MMPELATEVQRMAAMTVGQLQDRYAELWKHAPRSRNRTWLTRKIAWRLQMLAESGLSQRARERATALAEDAPLRSSLPTRLPLMPPPTPAKRGSSRDSRLPEVGTVIVREYQGRRLQVLVLERRLNDGQTQHPGRTGLSAGSLSHLHPQVQRRWPAAGVQFAGRSAGGSRGLRGQPATRRLGLPARTIRRWWVLRWNR